MSIFYKITLLFSVSLMLMLGIGYQIETINAEKYESLILQKYLSDGRKLFGWMMRAAPDELKSRLDGLNLVQIAPVAIKRTLIEQPHTFGFFELFESVEGDYVMHLRYLDDDLYLKESTPEQHKDWVLSLLVVADTVVLVLIFIIILRMLSPLRHITAAMRRFSRGDFKSRSHVASHDEIGAVSETYNDMAQTIENLIRSREALLRDVGHELRTPIARGLFALEQIPASAAHETLHRSLKELDQLTRELLEIEKLRVTDTLSRENTSVETVVLEALSKLSLPDESVIQVTISENFTFSANVQYLALALKNLLENALKYSDQLPVFLDVENRTITVRNHGRPLETELQELLHPFSRQERSRNSEGFGLGLDIIQKIVQKHGFELRYSYEAHYHCFSIVTGAAAL